jgi:large subunit ribosomal protein L21
MYAVVKTGGKQYKFEKGGRVKIEKLDGNVGDTITFDKILMINDGENHTIGSPFIENACVNATIVDQGKLKKIIVFKYKKRKRYRRKKGHRQHFTDVKIEDIRIS